METPLLFSLGLFIVLLFFRGGGAVPGVMFLVGMRFMLCTVLSMPLVTTVSFRVRAIVVRAVVAVMFFCPGTGTQGSGEGDGG